MRSVTGSKKVDYSATAGLFVALMFGCSSPASSGPGRATAGAGGNAAHAGAPSAGGGGAGGTAAQSNAGAAGSAVSLGGASGSASAGSAGAAAAAGAAAGADGTSGAGGTVGTAGTAGTAGTGTGPSVGIPKNPVLSGLNADPQIAAFGGKFYIYPTTDGFANWLSTQFHAFSSTDLVAWKDEGVILDLGPGVSWADSQAWAPGIALKNGTYYFYFAAATEIGVATATSPTGPFKDALGHALVTKGQYGGQSIDPYVLQDDDGRAYLYFGSGSTGHVVELNADMTSFKGTPQTISIAGFREGSVAFKRNGKYYFMYSEDDTRNPTYNVAYGMGTSPMGPFTKAAVNPILQEVPAQGILATGHNSVLQLPNGNWYIAYHRFKIPGGDGTHREVCLDRLDFNADDTIVPVKPTL